MLHTEHGYTACTYIYIYIFPVVFGSLGGGLVGGILWNFAVASLWTWGSIAPICMQASNWASNSHPHAESHTSGVAWCSGPCCFKLFQERATPTETESLGSLATLQTESNSHISVALSKHQELWGRFGGFRVCRSSLWARRRHSGPAGAFGGCWAFVFLVSLVVWFWGYNMTQDRHPRHRKGYRAKPPIPSHIHIYTSLKPSDITSMQKERSLTHILRHGHGSWWTLTWWQHATTILSLWKEPTHGGMTFGGSIGPKQEEETQGLLFCFLFWLRLTAWVIFLHVVVSLGGLVGTLYMSQAHLWLAPRHQKGYRANTNIK